MRAIISSEESALPEEAEYCLSAAPQSQEDGWYQSPGEDFCSPKERDPHFIEMSFTETAELSALLRDTNAAGFVRRLVVAGDRWLFDPADKVMPDGCRRELLG